MCYQIIVAAFLPISIIGLQDRLLKIRVMIKVSWGPVSLMKRRLLDIITDVGRCHRSLTKFMETRRETVYFTGETLKWIDLGSGTHSLSCRLVP